MPSKQQQDQQQSRQQQAQGGQQGQPDDSTNVGQKPMDQGGRRDRDSGSDDTSGGRTMQDEGRDDNLMRKQQNQPGSGSPGKNPRDQT